MICTALKNFIHELSKHEETKKVVGIISVKNFDNQIYLVFDDQSIEPFKWDETNKKFNVFEFMKYYANNNYKEIEFTETKDKG